jgi:hypothetical protein
MVFHRQIIIQLIFIICSFSIQARIGEDRLTFEKRLNSSGGYQYRSENVLSNRKRGMPYNKFLDLMPAQSEIRIYYKTLDGRKPLSKDIQTNRMLEGWDIHVVFVGGKSVLELYRRSSNMNELEFTALLKLQAGNSFWEKKEQVKEGDPPLVSAFSFDYERNDKLMRARKVGSSQLIFFSSQFDVFLAEGYKQSQMDALPQSIKGF